MFYLLRIVYENYTDFATDANDTLNFIHKADKFYDVSIIAKFFEAKEIIKEFIIMGYDISCIKIDNPSFSNYYDEYIISLCYSDNHTEIWCEPFKRTYDDRESEYIWDDSFVTYVLDNCSSKVLNTLDGENIIEVAINDFVSTKNALKSISNIFEKF